MEWFNHLYPDKKVNKEAEKKLNVSRDKRGSGLDVEVCMCAEYPKKLVSRRILPSATGLSAKLQLHDKDQDPCRNAGPAQPGTPIQPGRALHRPHQLYAHIYKSTHGTVVCGLSLHS